jgi:CubicO group peptidase (beta-lactamase class C family)
MPRLRLIPALAAMAVVVVLAACTRDTDTPAAPAGTATAARCDPALDTALGAWARAGFSGSVAVSTGGRVDCLAAYGSADDATGRPNTVDTVFSIGSVTKAFTAATVLDLAAKGRLRLDDRVGRFLPDLKDPVAGVTLRQLLLHTSGLTGSHGQDHRPLSREAALAAISDLRLAFPPGSDYVYSNAGYTLLGLVIEAVSGRGYRDHTAATILRLPGGRVAGGFWDGTPAAPGPRAVGYLDSGGAGESGDFAGPHWALDGNGSLAMTMRDLADWTHALFTGRLVAPEAVEAIVAPGHDLGEGRSETPGWVSVDASVHGTPFLASAGGGGDVGHDAIVAWVPRDRRVVAVASNTPGVSAEELLRRVGPALLAGRPLPTPSGQPSGGGPSAGPSAGSSAGASVGAAAPGRYELETGGVLEVATAGNQVTVTATGADAVGALLPPRGDVAAGDVSAHEKRVLALLAGRTAEGRQERKAVEDALGPVRDVRLAGTVVREGELRTYVSLVAGTRSVLGWYAVNEQGGIEGAEVPTDLPALALVPVGGGRYRPHDPAGTGPEVTVEFSGGRMVVTGPGGAVTARRAG